MRQEHDQEEHEGAASLRSGAPASEKRRDRGETGKEPLRLITRRDLLKAAGAAGLAVGLGPLVASCTSGEETSSREGGGTTSLEEVGASASGEARRLVILHTNDIPTVTCDLGRSGRASTRTEYGAGWPIWLPLHGRPGRRRRQAGRRC